MPSQESSPLVGIRIPPCAPLPVLADSVVRAERAGFDQAWFPDSQLLWRDVWMTLTAAAAATSRIGLGVAVSNFVTRHPAVTASAVRTLQEIAGDRLTVGFGTGSSSIKHLGIGPTKQAQMRDGFEALRTLLTGQSLELGGGEGQLRDATLSPPLYMAASGPKNLEFAGAVADGVMILSGISENLLRASIERVHRGAERSGRNPADVRINIAAFAHVTDNVRRDCAIVKPLAADLLLRGAGAALEAEGIFVSGQPREDSRVYPDYRHAEDWDAAAEVAGEVIDDDAAVRFAQRFCLVGDGPEIRARIAEIAALGVDEIYVQGVGSYHLPTDLIDGFGKEVLT